MIGYNPQFYSDDSQVGDKCFLDGKDAYIDFNADLKTFQVIPGKISSDYSKGIGRSDFNLFHYESEPMALTIEFYVGGASEEETQSNISNLLNTAKQCIIRKENDVFEYASVLTEQESEDTEVEPYYLVTCKFVTIRRKPIVRIMLEQSSIIFNDGNTSSGMCIQITPTKNIETYTIAGASIFGLRAGTTYIIDGMQGRVTANGVNYFSHTDIIEFPKIKPGKNEITMSEDMPVTISFYPVFS